MNCPTCQTQNPINAKFCNNCRKSLATAEQLDPEEWSEIMNAAL